jgi:hypothetical protein
LPDELNNDELARRAARTLTHGVVVAAGYDFPTSLHQALDALSSQPYEGRAGHGRVILAAAKHPEINMVMQFLPIRLDSARLMRKALEMTGDGFHLICDGAHLLGLGSLQPLATASATSDDVHETVDGPGPPDESIFEIDVHGQGVWELSYRGAPLLRITNTRPSLPKPRLSRDDFTDTATRLFPEATSDDIEALWLLAENASSAEHGTMLVVHRDAAAEASRLVPQAQRIAPTHLKGRTLRAATSIDGAILVDSSARCHAVGVILDGHATGAGDPGRGARFNSAVRYQQVVGADCMVVIVSEDGMIDLIPTLPRRVRPTEVERPLAALEAALQEEPDYEAFFRAWDHLEALAFYLTKEQCARANAARTAIEEDRAKPDPDRPPGLGFITHVSWTPFEPSPQMDSSYYLEEPGADAPEPHER